MVQNKPGPEVRRITTEVSANQWRRLREYALAENTTLQAIVVESIVAYMARKGIKP
jgi:hypothetical protein